ncbi:MAG: hypoxanthine phosphoribosyltransferase [Acidobacteria bacterium]|nr:hypoxanthine phosphoribosyltransferase [Acidobacteriota bacterium]MCA1611927.1 hypoxanthine phosphoribosyltransferase [Acidobacteriota bacterium]
MKLGQTLIDAATLDAGVARIAAEIDRDQAGRPALLVGILKGSIFFLCDLAKKLETTPVSLDFLQVSSYGSGTKSSGNVRLQRDLSTDVAGRDVIIVEDIVDTGRTLTKIIELLGTRHPKSVKICALLKKKIAGNEGIPVDYLGFTIDDHFVVGYGLDYAEMYRNLPFIGILEPEPEAGNEGREAANAKRETAESRR